MWETTVAAYLLPGIQKYDSLEPYASPKLQFAFITEFNKLKKYFIRRCVKKLDTGGSSGPVLVHVHKFSALI